MAFHQKQWQVGRLKGHIVLPDRQGWGGWIKRRKKLDGLKVPWDREMIKVARPEMAYETYVGSCFILASNVHILLPKSSCLKGLLNNGCNRLGQLFVTFFRAVADERWETNRKYVSIHTFVSKMSCCVEARGTVFIRRAHQSTFVKLTLHPWTSIRLLWVQMEMEHRWSLIPTRQTFVDLATAYKFA